MNKVTLAFFALAFATPVHAGMFSVTPVRIYMAPKDKAVAVTITNESEEDLVMQADVYAWNQKNNGEDDLALTEDMLLSPPIIKVPAKSHQVVRLARLIPPPQGQQKTFRLIVREIPEAKPGKDKTVQLQVALAFSMPVFITPPGARNKLDCAVVRKTINTVIATCENTGNAYAQPLEFILSNQAGDKLTGLEKAGYILPTIKRSFEIKSDAQRIPGGKAKLTVRMDDGSKQTFDVTLAE